MILSVLLNAKFLSVERPDIRNFAFSTLASDYCTQDWVTIQ
jgi:hypothetical protein